MMAKVKSAHCEQFIPFATMFSTLFNNYSPMKMNFPYFCLDAGKKEITCSSWDLNPRTLVRESNAAPLHQSSTQNLLEQQFIPFLTKSNENYGQKTCY